MIRIYRQTAQESPYDNLTGVRIVMRILVICIFDLYIAKKLIEIYRYFSVAFRQSDYMCIIFVNAVTVSHMIWQLPPPGVVRMALPGAWNCF